jgi:hypothetical protein
MSNGLKSRKELYEVTKREDSIFSRTAEDSSKTYLVCGRSFSGKTFFLTSELNKLIGEKRGGKGPDKNRPVYDLILILTESTDADPLKKLDKTLPILVMKGFYPRVVMLLKKIQDASKRSFRFLVILDDVVAGIRNGIAQKMILTLRNSHISTCLLMQYVKLISPAMRNSISELYITKLKSEEYEYLLQGFLSSHARECVGNIRSLNQLASDFNDYVGTDVLFYDQRRDKLGLIPRKPWLKDS